MEPSYVVMLLMRWVHILSAALALGVPIYVRFVLMPAVSGLEDSVRTQLHEAIMRRWRLWVHALIVLFLATGFYTYLVVARWKDPSFPTELRPRYHMLLGIKILIALTMFFISSALAGRSQALAAIRTNPRTWLAILITLGVVLVAISGVIRFLP